MDSTMIECVRRIQFCAGHRVFGHENKCAHLHGHNYVAFFHACRWGNRLDSIGRVVDFSVLKERIGGWIEREWDHGMILWEGDPGCQRIYEDFPGQKLFRAPFNPTAEEMAKYLLEDICPKLLQDVQGAKIVVSKVQIWETENCFAEVRL